MEFTALSTAELVRRALKAGTVIPGFNIPYLPMMEPVVRALRDTNSFGLIMVARLEWVKFESGSLEAIRDEYERVKDLNHTRLHLDHVPVIDEDDLKVDYEDIIRRAVAAGYDSVMIDGSRLPLEGNIDCTRAIAEIAHAAGIAAEAELGAVMGHEAGPLPPYDELFESGRGFTDPAEAKRFVEETNTDWLSVAVGSIHGAVSAARKDEKKVEARLDIDRLDAIRQAAGIPLVLHGGTGIRKEYIMRAIQHGIGKINVATAIRQPYEKAVGQSVAAGQEAVYQAMLAVIHDDLEIGNSAARLA
jgi:fructose-bisphosphate aldolase, class II